MISAIAFGAFVGGAVNWIWGAISWAVLPWHHATFLRFTHEDAMAAAVLTSCPESGVYGLPSVPRSSPGMSRADREALDRAAQQRMKTGPIITTIVQRTGFGSVPLAMLRAFVIYALASGVMSWLILRVSMTGYVDRTLFVCAITGVAGLLCRMTDWNWHGYSTSYTLVCVADLLVSGILTGLALSMAL